MAPDNPIFNLFAAGGVVMFPLLAFSILASALIIERVIFWLRLGSYQNSVVYEAINLYRDNNVVGTFECLRKKTDLPIVRIFLGRCISAGWISVWNHWEIVENLVKWSRNYATPIFAILAFFIISTMFLTRQQGLPVNLSNALTAKPQVSEDAITVTVDSKGKISLNSKAVTLNTLQPKLQELIGSQPQVLVMVQADKRVNHGTVVAVMDKLGQMEGVQLAFAAEKSQ